MSNPNQPPQDSVDPTLGQIAQGVEQVANNTKEANQRLQNLGGGMVALATGMGEVHREVQQGTAATEAVGTAVGDMHDTLRAHTNETKAGLQAVTDEVHSVGTEIKGVHGAVLSTGAATQAGLAGLQTSVNALSKAMTPPPPSPTRNLMDEVLGKGHSYAGITETKVHHQTLDPRYRQRGADGKVHLEATDAAVKAGVLGDAVFDNDYSDPNNPYGYTSAASSDAEPIASKKIKMPGKPVAMEPLRGTFDRGKERWNDRTRGRISRIIGGGIMVLYGFAKAPTEIASQYLVKKGRAAGGLKGAVMRTAGKVMQEVNTIDEGSQILKHKKKVHVPKSHDAGVKTRGNVTRYY